MPSAPSWLALVQIAVVHCISFIQYTAEMQR